MDPLKYMLEGFYLHEGQRGELSGYFYLGARQQIDGFVHDAGSERPEQQIRGVVLTHGVSAQMRFLKFPGGSRFANLVYSLMRTPGSAVSGDVTGEYKGRWLAIPVHLGLGHGDLLTRLTTLDETSAVGIGGMAELTVRK